MAVAPHLRPLTLEDYLAFPEKGDCEREIIRGRLFVAPRALPPHQFVIAQLNDRLRRHIVRRGEHVIQIVVDADLLMDEIGTYVSPDLMYFGPDKVDALVRLMQARERIHVARLRPALVVEVLSRGHEARDLVEKARDYAEVGIPHYWALDHERRQFHELVLPVGGGEYQAVTHTGRRVRPRLFADRRPALTLDLPALWPPARA